MAEDVIGSDEKRDSSRREQLAVAADYLGYTERVEGWRPSLLKEKEALIRSRVEFLRAFTDEQRMEIIIFLMHSGEKPGELPRYSVSEIARRFGGISMSTVSHHLQELKRVGVVRMERIGKERYYQIDLDYIVEWLGEWYERLRTKRDMLRQGLSYCPVENPKEIEKYSELKNDEDEI